jgi:hypothetical protein
VTGFKKILYEKHHFENMVQKIKTDTIVNWKESTEKEISTVFVDKMLSKDLEEQSLNSLLPWYLEKNKKMFPFKPYCIKVQKERINVNMPFYNIHRIHLIENEKNEVLNVLQQPDYISLTFEWNPKENNYRFSESYNREDFEFYQQSYLELIKSRQDCLLDESYCDVYYSLKSDFSNNYFINRMSNEDKVYFQFKSHYDVNSLDFRLPLCKIL